MLKRVLITTGGTGGHIFPALALARYIREMFPGCEIIFAGGEYGPEREMAAREGIKFRSFPARGVLGRGLKSLGSFYWMSRSLVQCLKFMRSFKPQVVVGFGGYAGFMPVLAARWLRIPTAVHEQNSFPGVTNKILGKKADRVFLSFPDEKNIFPPEKVMITGNPVRGELTKRVRHSSAMTGQARRLLVIGGSQGARAVNDYILKGLQELKAMNVEIWHQTGKADYQRVAGVYEKECPGARVEAFIDDMAEAYGFASLVVCRAGASTLAELCVMGKPSILIPFPYATHDHQMTNARYLENKGAAMVLAQSSLDGVNLARIILDLMEMPEKLGSMGRAALSMGNPDAAEKIVDELLKIQKKD